MCAISFLLSILPKLVVASIIVRGPLTKIAPVRLQTVNKFLVHLEGPPTPPQTHRQTDMQIAAHSKLYPTYNSERKLRDMIINHKCIMTPNFKER